MQQTFRATWERWLMLVVLPFGLGGFVMFWAARSGNLSRSLFFSVPAALFALWSTIRLVRDWMELDRNAIVAHVGGQSYEIPWRLVTAAALRATTNGPSSLRLVTADCVYTLPLRTLAQEKIWRLVQAYAPPPAVEPAAFAQALAHPGAIVPCVDLHDYAEGPLRVRVGTPKSVEAGQSLIWLGALIAYVALRWGEVGLPVGLLLLLGGLALVLVLVLALRSGTLRTGRC
jgi:hypothetical protein